MTGTIGLTQEFVDANSAEKLLSVVNSPIVPAGAQLSTKLGRPGLAGRRPAGHRAADQQDPRRPPVDDTQRDTVLAALRDTGFITYGTERIGAANTALVVTGGALGDDAGNQGATVARFAAGLAPHGSGTVARRARRVGDRDRRRRGDPVRRGAEPAPSAPSTTSTPSPGGSRVLALQELISGGRPGQYGIGQGATAVTVPQ